ncbi:MAG: serpin family protein, partial [Lachnospiraceae bacterium]|nr:serpin family protein [Lachnospiraceae bacterium]
ASGKKAKNVKWSVTKGKKKIKIKAKGKKVIITGLRNGEAVVTAKLANKKLKLKVLVYTLLEDPSNEETTEDPEDYSLELSAATKSLTANLTKSKVETSAASDAFAYDLTDFSLNTLRTIRSLGKSDKILISPDSISTAMAMVTNGADSTTKDELMSVLAPNLSLDDYNKYLAGLNNRLNADEDLIYQVSDSIWIKNTDDLIVSDDFLKTNYDYYNAEVYKSAFDENTVKDINGWVNAKTRHMIPEIIKRIDNENRMFLINTVAFEGKWAEQYSENAIKKYDFTNAANEKNKTEFLVGTEENYYKINDRLAFSKYYEGGAIKFVGILPNEGESVDQTLASMDGKAFVDGLRESKKADVYTRIPKFCYDYDVNLNETFAKLGLSESFSNSADFSKMTSPQSLETLKIGKVIHKTHIELDENGTKAAAATAVAMNKVTSIRPEVEKEQVYIYLDRPFVYALVDSKTNIPLFIGTVESLK